MENKGTVTILRFDPTVDKERYVYEVLDPGLSFREPCRQQICGACILLVNKKSVLACEAFSEEKMLIEPIPGRVILKDLITELPSV